MKNILNHASMNKKVTKLSVNSLVNGGGGGGGQDFTAEFCQFLIINFK
jgi:hypothetical protein